MGFQCYPYEYPLKSWILRSAAFALGIMSIVSIDLFYRDQPYLWFNACFGFFALFSVIMSNLAIHIYHKVKDPIKSPIKVKLLGLLTTFVVCLFTLLVSVKLKWTITEEINIINRSWFNVFLLAGIRTVVLNFFVLLWLYFLMTDHFKNQLEVERSKLGKLKERAVNQMLRQQVQPHFLFNALSSLKSLIKKDSAMAESYLLQLSEYLRGSFMTSDDGLAAVRQELKLCEDYLSMQKIRFNEAIQYDIQVSDSVLKDLLPIFSLQPLVDNALKHNIYTNEQPLCIQIREESGWIVVSNNVCLRKTSVDDNNNHGLNNLKERFSYYLKDSVIILDEGNCFKVSVKIISA